MIGVLDSGAGGANVIRACMKVYGQDFVYLVDNKNCPYGNKDVTLLKEIILNNLKYLIDNFDLDAIILGCNTASSLIDYEDMLALKIPIIKTYPSVEAIIKNGGNGIVFATKNTLKYSKYLKFYLLNYNNIKTVCVKNLAKYIDDNLSKNTIKTQKILKNKLKKAFFCNKKLKNKFKDCKSLALGCTHFKHIEKNLLSLFNKKIKIYECEPKVAKTSKFLIRKNKQKSTVKIVLTKPDETLQKAIEKLF